MPPAPRAPEPSSSRVPVLDVLRACAVLAVFVQHLGDRFRPMVIEHASSTLPAWTVAWLQSLLEHGHWGVDLFFVLSGFTLGMGFVRDHDRGRLRPAREFFLRRAARILPAFYLAVFVHLLARPALLHAPHLPASLAVHALVLQGYLSPGGIVLIGASWSLTTESHFYLAAPWLARRLLALDASSHEPFRRVARLAAAALAVCVPVWILRGVLHDYALGPQAPAGLLELSQRRWVVCRIDQFVLGIAAAVAHARLRESPSARRASWIAVGFALGALALAAPLDRVTWPNPGGGLAYVLVSIALTALVLGCALLPTGGRARFALAPLGFLGVVSYGFFLYHQLAIELCSRWIPAAGGAPSWTSLAVTAVPALAVAVLAGWWSWVAIESPALEWIAKSRASRRGAAER